MEIRRPFRLVLPEDLFGLAHVFERAGHQLYLVGGAVRDAVMGLKPKDFDVATDATPDRVLELLRDIRGWKTDEVGKAFGVVRARSCGPWEEHNHEYEIATFRQDIGEGRRPESVVFTSIEEDVKRRDLTINALFYDIMKQEIVDLVGGLADIEAGVIRTVGAPEDRFREDRLRVLRALRFVARFDWSLELETAKAIIADNSLFGVSPERVRDEFVKGIASSQHARGFIRLLEEFAMWPVIFPGLKVVTSPDVMVSSSGVESRAVATVLAVLLDSEPVERVIKRLSELKYTSTEVSHVAFLRRFKEITVDTAYRLKKLSRSIHISDEMIIDYCSERGEPDVKMLQAFIGYELSVSGEALLKRGLTGADLGRELERLETVQFHQLLRARSKTIIRSLEADEEGDKDRDD